MNFLFTEPFVSIVHFIAILGSLTFYLWSSRKMHCPDKNFAIIMIVLGVSSFYGGIPDTFVPVNHVGMFIALVGLCIPALFIVLIIPSMMREGI